MTLGTKVLVLGVAMGLSGSIFATTVTFNDLSLEAPVASQYASFGVAFNISRGTAQVIDQSYVPQSPFSDQHLWVRTIPGEQYAFLTISFGSEGTPTPVEASSISFDIADISTHPLVVVQSYAHDASLLEELFVFDPVQNVHLRVGKPSFIVILDALKDGFLIDNVTFAPEPVTMIPVGIALVGLGVVIHRRKKTQPSPASPSE